MVDPDGEIAARAALNASAAAFGVEVAELTVVGVLRRRRRATKVPFYYVTIAGPRGDYLRYQVSDNGARVEPDPARAPEVL